MKYSLNDGVANSWPIKMLNNHSVKTYEINRTEKEDFMQEENAGISLGGPGSQQPMENIIIRVYLANSSPSAPLENINFFFRRKNPTNFKQTKKDFLT